MPGGLSACAEGWRETHSTQDLGSPGKAASFSQTAFPKRASGYSPTRIKGAKGRRGAGRLAMQGTGRGQLGRALRPGSPARAHSWVREGGAAPARTFQRLLRPSSLFSPVPVISQAVLDPALSANSQNPSRFWSQLQGPWSECPDHLPWNNCLPTTHTHTHTTTGLSGARGTFFPANSSTSGQAAAFLPHGPGQGRESGSHTVPRGSMGTGSRPER